jgi:hypothetical protein
MNKIIYVLIIVIPIVVIFLVKDYVVKIPTQSDTLVCTDSSSKFTLNYPVGYTVDDTYTYTNLGPSTTIPGVKFTIPNLIATSTNLSVDSYLSIEHISNISRCTPEYFMMAYSGRSYTSFIDEDTRYNVASTTEAAAGNRYEEYIYALDGTNPCIAIRYYIHSSAIENYTPGTRKEFNKQELLAQFDAMRKSLVLRQ